VFQLNGIDAEGNVIITQHDDGRRRHGYCRPLSSRAPSGFKGSSLALSARKSISILVPPETNESDSEGFVKGAVTNRVSSSLNVCLPRHGYELFKSIDLAEIDATQIIDRYARALAGEL
jgi:hypothetical protein